MGILFDKCQKNVNEASISVRPKHILTKNKALIKLQSKETDLKIDGIYYLFLANYNSKISSSLAKHCDEIDSNLEEPKISKCEEIVSAVSQITGQLRTYVVQGSCGDEEYLKNWFGVPYVTSSTVKHIHDALMIEAGAKKNTRVFVKSRLLNKPYKKLNAELKIEFKNLISIKPYLTKVKYGDARYIFLTDNVITFLN